jgi:hypothetical protein
VSDKYEDQKLTVVELLNRDYPQGHSWVEGQYSKALQAMEKTNPPAVAVSRVEPLTRTGKATRKISEHDAITFAHASSTTP